MFFLFRNRTKIKLLVTNYLNTARVCTVYDVGNGPFICAYASTVPRYLKRDGTFENPNYRSCNGDPASWAPHIGDIDSLGWKNQE